MISSPHIVSLSPQLPIALILCPLPLPSSPLHILPVLIPFPHPLPSFLPSPPSSSPALISCPHPLSSSSALLPCPQLLSTYSLSLFPDLILCPPSHPLPCPHLLSSSPALIHCPSKVRLAPQSPLSLQPGFRFCVLTYGIKASAQSLPMDPLCF